MPGQSRLAEGRVLVVGAGGPAHRCCSTSPPRAWAPSASSTTTRSRCPTCSARCVHATASVGQTKTTSGRRCQRCSARLVATGPAGMDKVFFTTWRRATSTHRPAQPGRTPSSSHTVRLDAGQRHRTWCGATTSSSTARQLPDPVCRLPTLVRSCGSRTSGARCCASTARRRSGGPAVGPCYRCAFPQHHRHRTPFRRAMRRASSGSSARRSARCWPAKPSSCSSASVSRSSGACSSTTPCARAGMP